MISLRGGQQSTEDKVRGKKRGVLELAGVEDFGGEARGMAQILNIAGTLPCNFIMTAHYIVIENTNVMTGKTTTTKQLVTAGKKVAARVPVNFDEIYFFEKQASLNTAEPPRFIVKTQGDDESFAGTVLPLAFSWQRDSPRRLLLSSSSSAIPGQRCISIISGRQS